MPKGNIPSPREDNNRRLPYSLRTLPEILGHSSCNHLICKELSAGCIKGNSDVPYNQSGGSCGNYGLLVETDQTLARMQSAPSEVTSIQPSD